MPNIHHNGAIHALGNGQLAAYGNGPDLIQVFGPPYGSPSFLSLRVQRQGTWIYVREPGAAIYTHTSGDISIQEWVDGVLPVYVRDIRTTTPVELVLSWPEHVRVAANNGQLTVWSAAGSMMIYTLNPTRRPVYHQIAVVGADTTLQPDGLHIHCNGHATVYIAGGPEWPEAVTHVETIMAQGVEASLESARWYWRAYASQRGPIPEALVDVADDVATLIHAQQATDGGVLAGYNYHMAYVRDQYGVHRGLLAMGHYSEAEAIMRFYWDIWQRAGRIHNAHASGVPYTKHIHENDDVEITGYLLIQAFDLYNAAHNDDFIRMIQPMLDWAMEAQMAQLQDGALPFNGDETYVAGGFLTRAALLHRSLDATMLFHTGASRFAAWAEGHGAWSVSHTDAVKTALRGVEAAFSRHFLQGGIWCNDPQTTTKPPRFRHGVCQGGMHFGWSQRAADGYYYCPQCYAEIEAGTRPLQAPFTERVALASVSLMPMYINASLIPEGLLAPQIDSMLTRYHATGSLPSRPDATGAVGYDYGLLLYNLAQRGHPDAREICEKMLSVRDITGAWVEYYESHKPSGTMCRPWESAINMEAALMFLKD